MAVTGIPQAVLIPVTLTRVVDHRTIISAILSAVGVRISKGIAGIANSVIVTVGLCRIADMEAVIPLVRNIAFRDDHFKNRIRLVSKLVAIDITVVRFEGKTFIDRAVTVIVGAIEFFFSTREDTVVVIIAIAVVPYIAINQIERLNEAIGGAKTIAINIWIVSI